MTGNRKRPTDKDRRHIIGMSGGRCNKCRTKLFIENELSEKTRLADDAHIIAASAKGPRGSDDLTDNEKAAAANLILVCKNCHAEIDQQPEKFTEDVLLEIRQEHYRWVDGCMGAVVNAKPLFHYLSYINVPRADMYAVANSISIPQISHGSANSIRDLGFGAGQLMRSYTHLLNQEELYANELSGMTKLDDLEVGSYWFSDEAVFHSRNVGSQEGECLTAAWEKEECIIYRKFDGWRLICTIDPRWITTTTAHGTLRAGTFKHMGLFHVNVVNQERMLAWVSPLFLGAPDKGQFL